MMQQDFESILNGTIQGDLKALECLLNLYQPLIRKYSYVNGRFDEDLYQQLIFRTLKQVRRFELSDKRGAFQVVEP